jgi:hypothetical protein
MRRPRHPKRDCSAIGKKSLITISARQIIVLAINLYIDLLKIVTFEINFLVLNI